MLRSLARPSGGLLAVALALAAASTAAHAAVTSTKFEGPKANTGTVTFSMENGKRVLELSNDFVVPDTPDPHWQVVDSHGMTHLLQRLALKDGKVNRKIELPAHVNDVAKVQIWCAFAEVVLGEASFSTPAR